ncbi:Rieske 2Fe-2S domain-containing protein [Solitalea sp. MAHUQ-68]|uniref:Rieske 2Fe-2S domain-containing protein n=1 Tax=Solitalea agri TaxID=2953739 RepID=A0A9X2F5I7_9SPHI|nr:Rieske 2Fe-2S domain-containing protein [Solitalea agri]MCO4294711.1 Rieske 2Fe-2S domain-containing protein [Solitalea agri]
MKRNEFLSKLGIGAAIICAGSLLDACGGGDSAEPNNNNGGNNGNPLNFTLNIDTDLPNVGSSKTKQGVIVVRTANAVVASSFVALEAVCPHEHGSIFYDGTNNRLECSLHQSRYQLDGAVINGPVNASGSTRTLKKYKIEITGNIMTVTDL